MKVSPGRDDNVVLRAFLSALDPVFILFENDLNAPVVELFGFPIPTDILRQTAANSRMLTYPATPAPRHLLLLKLQIVGTMSHPPVLFDVVELNKTKTRQNLLLNKLSPLFKDQRSTKVMLCCWQQ